MSRMACTEPQCLHKGAVYLLLLCMLTWDARDRYAFSPGKGLCENIFSYTIQFVWITFSLSSSRAELSTVMFQVYFAAINCWQPHSECRQQFSRVQHFPVLIVYTQNNKGIQYKGIREAAHMIRFLRDVLHPLERITSPADVTALMSTYDVSINFCP